MSGDPSRGLPAGGTTDVVVVGAGHAGLAMSRCLGERALDHVVLERGGVANAWRHERWDSLRLLTPNWQNGLPGFGYAGDDPDGFMTMPQTVAFIEAYARSFAAPVCTATTVASVRAEDGGYRVTTDRGSWRCRAVVLASGVHGIPVVPRPGAALQRSVATLTADRYRNPAQLEDSGVLVVGASATGVQLADEISRSGRPVTLAVGEHIRMPRMYRDRDIQYWLDATGMLDQRLDEVEDIVRARRVPSPQLAGTADRAMLDLNALAARGVRIVGRFVGAADGQVQFSGSLRNHCAMADLKLGRLLTRIDEWIDACGTCRGLPPPQRFAPTTLDGPLRLCLDLRAERIGTIVWATGFAPDYSWLELPVFDRKGRLQHEGGVVAIPGMYTLGHTFMRRRKSSFICGAGDDVRDLCGHLDAYLRAGRRRPPLRAVG